MFVGKYGLPSEGPISADAWKRTVLRSAPINFRVTLLPPEKQGGSSSSSYGFCIYGESIIPGNEYVVWRKWEDCLWFQEGLEVVYSRAAREKRTRLVAGKGVKKNGVYIHSDQAASWESLPCGPHPSDVAWDIHQYIPKLSKKGSLFRASEETVDQRYQELRKMLQALLQDELPTLIKEIKATRTFTDFFGLWRRDVELARKTQQKPDADRPRPSFSNSILSALPLSPSSLSAKLSSPTKGKAQAQIPISSASSTRSDSSLEERPSRYSDRGEEIHSMKSRASSTSRSSSSSPSTPITTSRQLSSTSQQPVVVSPEALIRFGHSPHTLSGERNSFSLESLPEDRELSSSPKPDLDSFRSQRRTGSTSNVNRNARVFVSPRSGSLESSERSSRSLPRYSRASLQSTYSSGALRAAAYLDELDVDYCLPSPTPEPRLPLRASLCSLASLVTNSSVDAVIPRDEWPPRSSMTNMQRPRQYEPWSEDDSQSVDQGDFLDVYFQDMIAPQVQTPTGYPETPTVGESMYHFPREQSTSTVCSFFNYSDSRSSCSTSISSESTSSSGNPMMISIKATHEDNIVLLRVPRYITYDELRQKLYDKFISTNKSTICETFAMAVIEQALTKKVADGRLRADSMSSLESTRTKDATLRFISSQEKWDAIATTHCGKLFLQIIGSRE